MTGIERWMVAEFNPHWIFNGWHLYLRDTNKFARNSDGSWGWLRRGSDWLASAHAALAGISIVMRPSGDGTCDDDGYAAFARRFPIRRSKTRGGLVVVVDGGGITIVDERAIRAKGDK